MADLNQIRSSIERAVSSRLTQQADQFRKEVIEQVLREIEPLLASSGASGPAQSLPVSSVSGILSSTISAIQASTVQADILKALLEGVSKFSARTALFVVRGTALAGWQARGFADDNIRGLTLDGSKGLAARAIQGRDRVSGAATEFDAAFVQQHGAPADRNAMLFPLIEGGFPNRLFGDRGACPLHLSLARACCRKEDQRTTGGRVERSCLTKFRQCSDIIDCSHGVHGCRARSRKPVRR